MTDNFESLYRKHRATVLRYAVRRIGRFEVAEEITSEAFLRLYRKGEEIDPARLPAWLFTVVRNLATSYWRQSIVERKYVSTPVPVPKTSEPGLLSSILGISRLKPIHRTCLILRYVHGMERTEIAARLGLTENQVKSHLQYSLKLLRKHLSSGEE